MQLRRMRHELGWSTAPKLEQILIERIVQTWLRLYWLELMEAQSSNRTQELINHQTNRIE